METKELKPNGDFGVIDGTGYFATSEELELLSQHLVKWSKNDKGEYILVPNDPTEERKQKRYRARIIELKKMLSDSDYKAIKYAEGFISETEYTITKAQRQAWRDEINTLEGMLK